MPVGGSSRTSGRRSGGFSGASVPASPPRPKSVPRGPAPEHAEIGSETPSEVGAAARPRRRREVEAPAPPKALTARIPGELYDEWDDRLTKLALPRGVPVAAAMRLLLDLGDDELRARVSDELLRQRADQQRRRVYAR